MFKQYRLRVHPVIEVAVCKLTAQNVQRLALFCGGLQVEMVEKSSLVMLELPTKKGYVRVIEGEYIVVSHRPNYEVQVFKEGALNLNFEPVPVRRTNGS